MKILFGGYLVQLQIQLGFSRLTLSSVFWWTFIDENTL